MHLSDPSSAVLSVDYVTQMEVSNSTWAEQMDGVEKGLSASIYATYPIDPTPYTFALQHHNIHSVPTYTYAEPTRARQEMLWICSKITSIISHGLILC